MIIKLQKIQQQLNSRLSENLFVAETRPGAAYLRGYYPVAGLLCRVVVDCGKPVPVLAQPVPWWQRKWLRPEQNLFNVVGEVQEEGYVVTPMGNVPAVQHNLRGIWFKIIN